MLITSYDFSLALGLIIIRSFRHRMTSLQYATELLPSRGLPSIWFIGSATIKWISVVFSHGHVQLATIDFVLLTLNRNGKLLHSIHRLHFPPPNITSTQRFCTSIRRNSGTARNHCPYPLDRLTLTGHWSDLVRTRKWTGSLLPGRDTEAVEATARQQEQPIALLRRTKRQALLSVL